VVQHNSFVGWSWGTANKCPTMRYLIIGGAPHWMTEYWQATSWPNRDKPTKWSVQQAYAGERVHVYQMIPIK
jgi:hypothetical protein